MVPRVQSRVNLFTNVLLFSIATYAAVYGVTYAYVLHHLANILCAWLVAIHFDLSSWSKQRLDTMVEGINPNSVVKKHP
jgi:glycosylphosphatidylinositol deacylase